MNLTNTAEPLDDTVHRATNGRVIEGGEKNSPASANDESPQQ